MRKHQQQHNKYYCVEVLNLRVVAIGSSSIAGVDSEGDFRHTQLWSH
jgi:hypothetical protein